MESLLHKSLMEGLLQTQAQLPGHSVAEQGILSLVLTAIALGLAHAICADVWRGLKLAHTQVVEAVIALARAAWKRMANKEGEAAAVDR